MNNVSVISSDKSFELYADRSVDQETAMVTLDVSSTATNDHSGTKLLSAPGSQKICIPRDVMDRVAIEWVKKRHLQGEVIGPLAIWLL